MNLSFALGESEIANEKQTINYFSNSHLRFSRARSRAMKWSPAAEAALLARRMWNKFSSADAVAASPRTERRWRDREIINQSDSDSHLMQATRKYNIKSPNVAGDPLPAFPPFNAHREFGILSVNFIFMFEAIIMLFYLEFSFFLYILSSSPGNRRPDERTHLLFFFLSVQSIQTHIR